MRCHCYGFQELLVAIVLHVAFLSPCGASDQDVKGLYINYEGAEYERAFIPCSSEEVWRVEGFEALEELSMKYESSKTSEYGELFVVLKGRFSPVDKVRFPDSHTSGEFYLVEFISSSTDSAVIDECRGSVIS